ncbi:hypothetical protein D9756_000110 [Leucocoprinus leucothites]|uniref:Uncharacterized protein n=1 Tax=Leucocoprinus leucothites TaxID=201217 RepID=A0A8H5GEK8_9AGAR|nr:hypothetical protein D9756_000110 [Leucoagaricus leucothites]
MAKRSMLAFLYDQCGTAPPPVGVDLKGKTVLVEPGEGEAAIQRLEMATGYNKAELWLIDLAEFSSVKEFADRASKELERLDIVVLNAAIATLKYSVTKDSWETELQVNNLSLSLLALLLLPRMSDTAQKFNVLPRMVVVSSDLHFWTNFDDKVIGSPNVFSLLSSKEYCTPKNFAKRYVDTKLLNVFFTRGLNNRLKDRSIIVNTVNPAFCYSELRREWTGLFNTIFEWLFAWTTEEGSRQLVWASVGVPEGGIEKLKGAYIHLSKVMEPSDSVLGDEGKKKEDKLWNDLISILTELDPRVADVVNQHLQ